MELFTKQQYELLIKNGSDQNPEKDHRPEVMLFMTNTNWVWLLSELDPNNPDIAFGLCDLGVGCPELGYVSISELKEAQCSLSYLERNSSFKGSFPISVYANAAHKMDVL